MQDEGRSYPREGNFGSRGKEGEADEERRMKEERKEEAVGSRTEAAGDREEDEGRTRV